MNKEYSADYDGHSTPKLDTEAYQDSDGLLLRVPVVQEDLELNKATRVIGTVRIVKTVESREQTVDEPTKHEDVEIKRVPMGIFVDAPPKPRQEGDTYIVPVLEEVLVVERRLRLTEEVHITRRTSSTSQPTSYTVRTENVTVERERLAETAER